MLQFLCKNIFDSFSEEYVESSSSTLKLGVITPTYNRIKFLKKHLRQIQQQEDQDWKIFIVHDGPSDKFSTFMAKSDESDDRVFSSVTEAYHGDWGVTPRCEGIEIANSYLDPTDYIVFWDDDDSFVANAVGLIRDQLRLSNYPDLLLVPFITYNSELPAKGVDLHKLDRTQILQANLVVRLKIASEFYRKTTANSKERGEDYRFFDALRSQDETTISFANCEPIGRYDGLRFWQTIRWKIKIPSLGISESRFFRKIRPLLRR